MVYIQFTCLLVFIINKVSPVTIHEARSTINHIHSLQHRLEASISNLNHIPLLTRSLKTNIHQVSSKSRIPRIISSSRSQLSGSSQCSRQARDLFNSLDDSSKEEATACAVAAIKKVETLSIEVGRLILKATDVKNDVVGRITNCIRSNAPNEVGVALCLVAQVYPVQESVAQLESAAQNMLTSARETADDILSVLKECVSEAEELTENRSRSILTNYHNCSKSPK